MPPCCGGARSPWVPHLVLEQELVPADEDLPQPLQDVGPVHHLLAGQSTADEEEDLRAGAQDALLVGRGGGGACDVTGSIPDVPEGLDGKIRIPQLDGLRLVQNQQGLETATGSSQFRCSKKRSHGRFKRPEELPRGKSINNEGGLTSMASCDS